MPFGDIDRRDDVRIFEQGGESGAGASAHISVQRSLGDVAGARADKLGQRISIDDRAYLTLMADADIVAQHLPVRAGKKWLDVGFDEIAESHSVAGQFVTNSNRLPKES